MKKNNDANNFFRSEIKNDVKMDSIYGHIIMALKQITPVPMRACNTLDDMCVFVSKAKAANVNTFFWRWMEKFGINQLKELRRYGSFLTDEVIEYEDYMLNAQLKSNLLDSIMDGLASAIENLYKECKAYKKQLGKSSGEDMPLLDKEKGQVLIDDVKENSYSFKIDSPHKGEIFFRRNVIYGK